MVLVYCTSSNICVCTKFNFNPYCTFQDMARTGIYYGKNGYGKITLSIYKLGLLFWCTALSLTAIYLKPSFISISWVLKISQDMARTSIHYEKWLREDNSIHIHGRIMVLGFSPSPHCHLFINQVSFKCQQ